MPKINTNNITIQAQIYKTNGTNKNKYPIVLVRGLGSQLISWPESLIKIINEQGFDVVVYDNRDSGLSTHISDYSEKDITQANDCINKGITVKNPPYSLYDMAEDLKGVIKYFNFEKIHLVGCSMGGMIVQIFGQKYNNLLKSLCIIFSSTGAKHLPKISKETLFFLAKKKPTSDKKKDILHHMALSNLYFSSPKMGVTYEGSYQRAKKLYERHYDPMGYKRQWIAINSTDILYENNKKITAPTLIMTGYDDIIFSPEHSYHIKKTIGDNATIKVIKDWGHDMPEQFMPYMAENIILNCKKSNDK